MRKLRLGSQTPALREEQTSKLGSLHREIGLHPARGLTPHRLAAVLEGAAQGDLMAQCDLFQDMEERDGHLFSELSKRRRSVLGLDWSLVAPRDASDAEKRRASELETLLHDTLDVEDVIWQLTDAIGKGFAALEVQWQRHGQRWQMEQLTPRPQRWFMVAPHDRNTLRLRDGAHAEGAELWPLGWVVHAHAAKSGYLPENALFRVLAWPYLFKQYSVRDLAEFLEIYGLPLRLGKYPSGASKQEKATLMRAVMGIGHAAGGIIPQSMEIDFKNAADGHADPFLAMMQWAEATQSKAIVGQTLTSQAGPDGSGSRALGEVHDKVRRDITISDARQLQGTLTRQVVLPLGLLGGLIDDVERAPAFVFDVSEPEDMGEFSLNLPRLVNMGMQIPTHWAHQRLGIPEASDDEEVLQRTASADEAYAPMRAALRARPGGASAARQMAAQLAAQTQGVTGAWLQTVQDILASADSLDEARTMLLAAFDDLDGRAMAEQLGAALAAAHAAGRFELEQQSG